MPLYLAKFLVDAQTKSYLDSEEATNRENAILEVSVVAASFGKWLNDVGLAVDVKLPAVDWPPHTLYFSLETDEAVYQELMDAPQLEFVEPSGHQAFFESP